MAGPASDYHRGEMDIQEQVSTYNLVMGLTKWGSLAIVSVLLVFILWFCTSFGFLGAFITGVVVAVLGTLLLRDKKAAH